MIKIKFLHLILPLFSILFFSPNLNAQLVEESNGKVKIGNVNSSPVDYKLFVEDQIHLMTLLG